MNNYPEYGDFGEFFRKEMLPDLIKRIEPALDHLRRTDPQQWLRIAMEMRKRGGYDRIEQMKEMGDGLEAIIKMLADGLKESIPEFVRQHTQAVERHYVQHGLELDDLLRRSPAQEPMTPQQSVEAQLRAMGVDLGKINPSDNR